MARPGAGSPVRAVAVLIVAALTTFQVIRTAAVADEATRPVLATALWPSHPRVLTDQVLLTIAAAAARGQDVPPATRVDVRRIAARAPLSPDPFLIEGAIAQTQGRSEAAERLLLAARARDPRSRGTRYLLAERFLRTGRVTEALVEMQALVSLHERGAEPFVPALVAYALTPGAVPQLKAFFARHPRVESAVLSQLAADPANAGLVLALANQPHPDPDWRGTLVSALASAGQYARARAVWARLSGGAPDSGLFNPSFRPLPAPPPFNWAFPASSEGVAEPDGKGGLNLLYYGRAAAVLGQQLLTLSEGRYRLTMTVGASRDEGAIHWRVRCATGEKILADVPLRAGSVAVTFEVPPDCAAQWLELHGVTGDLPRTSELTLRELRLGTAG